MRTRSVLIGPFAPDSRVTQALGLFAVVLALLLTQFGALFVWLGLGLVGKGLVGKSRPNQAPGDAQTPRSRSRWHRLRVLIAIWGTMCVAYVIAVFSVIPAVAGLNDRVPLPCFDADSVLQPYNLFFCLSNRHYVTREFADVLTSLSDELARELPGRKIYFLDGGFPLGGGFPLLPHLSHGDGRRLDLAFLYHDDNGTPQRSNGSPIGYFAFVPAPASSKPICPDRWPSLRWDLTGLQKWIRQPSLDDRATGKMLATIAAHPRIGKLLLEPHLTARLRLTHDKIRFQGCRAARHDDHVHIQL